MPNLHELENAMPVAPLKLVALQSAADLGNKVNDYLVEFRSSVHNKYVEDPAFQGYSEQNYQLDFTAPRFNSGEGKAVLNETVRGKDLFIIVDVCNHSLTYNMNGYENHMSPDDHYQELNVSLPPLMAKHTGSTSLCLSFTKDVSIEEQEENLLTVLLHSKNYVKWAYLILLPLMLMIPGSRMLLL